MTKPMKDQAHAETDKLISNLTKKLRHTYSKAYGDAAEKFMVYMTAFERKDTAHRADVAAGRWTEQEYTNWRRNQLLYADTLAGIRDTLAQDLHNVNKIAIKMVRDEQVDVYALNHNYGTYEVEHGLGIDTSFTLYDHDTVERLMKEDPDLLPKPSARRQAEIDAKDIAWNKQKLASTFTASILAGDSIPKMAERIATVAAMDQNAAIRNARTMCTGAENAGRNDSYKRAKGMGINLKQEWMSTLDERTRDSHVQLDGEVVEVGQKYSNGLRYPGDPEGPAAEVMNCRCTQVAVVNGIDPGAFDKTATLQWKLDNKDITYEQWKEEHRKKMDYRKVELSGKSRSNDEKEGPVVFQKITSLDGKFYLSENAKVKPRKLHSIELMVRAAESDIKSKGESPNIVLIGDGDLGKNTAGRFASATNTVYIRPLANDGAQKHAIYHEHYHWQDWQEYKERGFDTEQEFIDFMCEIAKKKLDKLGITGQNVRQISLYAKLAYDNGRYDEVYTEYRTKQALER